MVKNLIQKLAIQSYVNPASFLRWTTAVIFGISTAAQAGGLVINKSIPKQEKKFLILQESMNGVLELATFLAITSKLEKFAAKLVDSGKIVSKSAMGNPAFKKGVIMGFSLFGTILAFNIITPLLRNPIAAFLQKRLNIEDKQQLTRPLLPASPLNPNIRINSDSPFSGFHKTVNTSKIQTKYPVFTSGSLRI